MSRLLSDARMYPNAFGFGGPVSAEVVRAWVAEQRRPIPDDLVRVWTTMGGGDLFESEELYSPLAVPEFVIDSIDTVNRYYAKQGLNSEYLVFHDGVDMSAMNPSGAIVRLDSRTLRPVIEFESFADWYEDLRATFGDRYGLE